MGLVENKVDEQFIIEMNKFREKPEGKKFIEACSENVVLFSEFMLGLKLYAWQIKFLNSIMRAVNKETTQREFLALTSRQIGKSTAIAVFALWAAVFNKYPGTIHNNTIVGIISASEVQSRKLLGEIRRLARTGDKYLYEKYGESLGKEFFSRLISKDEANNTATFTFKASSPEFGPLVLAGSKSGSVIKSYPPTSVILGETFTIIVEDEAGKTDRMTDELHYDYVLPTGNSTNAIRIYLSTPWVPSGFFYTMCDPFDEYGSQVERFVFTIEAIKLENPEYYDTLMNTTVKRLNELGKHNEVQRAYYCRFVKGEKTYFDIDTVTSSFQDYPMFESYPGECDMGVDFGGQVVSRTVITISRLTEDRVVERLYKRVYEVGQDDNLIDDILELKTRFNVQRIIPDDCPQGDYLIREMKDLGWNVQPMNFRTDKVKKYGAFRSYLNKSRIKSFKDDDLKTEMLALENSEGSRQSVIMHAPGYTDDLIDSFVLSTYFMVEEEGEFNFYKYGDYDDDD